MTKKRRLARRKFNGGGWSYGYTGYFGAREDGEDPPVTMVGNLGEQFTGSGSAEVSDGAEAQG